MCSDRIMAADSDVQLFLQASQMYKDSIPDCGDESTEPVRKKKTFAKPVSVEEIKKQIEEFISNIQSSSCENSIPYRPLAMRLSFILPVSHLGVHTAILHTS
jgi:hypothetical protein